LSLPDRIYWDSNVFLAWLQSESGRVAACQSGLDAAQRGDFLIGTSALTIAETLWLKKSPRLTKEKAELLNRFFLRSSMRVVNLDRQIAQRAQRLVWESGVKPKDSVHIATALRYRCPVLETFDKPLIKKGSGLGGVEIREPQPAAQGILDI